ncbi:VTT domain-containing protein [Geobacter sp. DSM 9736]|uniref:YqaA family protein n=1 Tax=Geobacter sp. DSM 9736 TaxID=1277350 RepID=UPI00156196E0
MNDLLVAHGYPALFLLSFLASSLVPLGSEWLLVTMLLKKHDPVASVAVASIGNYLGACTTYWIGLRGGDFMIRKLLRIDENAQQRAEKLYTRYGSWSLLFSWLPIVGDPMCLVGGILKVRFINFSVLVFTGKTIRYATVAWLIHRGMSTAW